jgi:Na+/H+ antiporter NhaD/arsenite permease-like protein
MTWLLIAIFVLGYAMIVFEHNLHFDKAGAALLTGVLCWGIYALNSSSMVPPDSIPTWFQQKVASANHEAHETSGDLDQHPIEGEAEDQAHPISREWLLEGQLSHLVAEVAGILFFLMAAMTIVEVVDAFEGFTVITSAVRATSRIKLLWIISLVTFFLSAMLDNLTTTIVMISLVRKLVADRDTKLFYAGMIVVAANAGGAWSVIGDVTTTMLWIKGLITPMNTSMALFLPSLTCLLVPLIVLSMVLRGNVERPADQGEEDEVRIDGWQSNLMFTVGALGLLSIPIFKTYTHLPPFMGALLSLSIVWLFADVLRRKLDEPLRSSTHVVEILRRVDTGSVLFFLGILLAVGSLSATGILTDLAVKLDDAVGNYTVIAVMIGLLSSVVDNVPLVAAGMQMYDFPADADFWLLLAYCAGTGGSCLVIGSAAGVAAMGLEKINFFWYAKNIGPWALLGYLSGVGVYWFLNQSGLVFAALSNH